jgi:hypothetical protein
MLRAFLAATVTLTAAALLACGDDDADSSPTPTATRTAAGSPTETEQAVETSTPDNGAKTPEPTDETAGPTSPAATAPGEVPTTPPTAASGTPAVRPADEQAFLAQFQGQDIQFVECTYDFSSRLVDCPGYGLYAIDPPIVGQDVTCSTWVLGGAARAVQCSSVEPQQTIYYEIQ